MQISSQAAAEGSDTWWNFSLWLRDSKTGVRMIEEMLLSNMTQIHGCIRALPSQPAHRTILRKGWTHHGLHELQGP